MMAILMGLKTVSPAALAAELDAQRVQVFDVNSPQSYARGHVPGARNLDHEAFTEGDLPADRAAPVVFYCSNPMCRKAPIAARRAKAMGYTAVRVLAAGITGWEKAGLPTVEGGR